MPLSWPKPIKKRMRTRNVETYNSTLETKSCYHQVILTSPLNQQDLQRNYNIDTSDPTESSKRFHQSLTNSNFLTPSRFIQYSTCHSSDLTRTCKTSQIESHQQLLLHQSPSTTPLNTKSNTFWTTASDTRNPNTSSNGLDIQNTMLHGSL